MPGNAADFSINDTFDTFAEQAVCFLNLETNYRSSLSPVGIRLGNRLTGKPVHVDISDEPMKKGICTNRNKFILGPSGSGKSFFTNHMVRSYYEQGTHIVLVDVGHSYKDLCDMVNGYYFTYDEKSPIRFNPFYIGEGDSLDTEKKESIKTLLLALWKKDNETFNRSEYVALSTALQLYYEKLDREKSVLLQSNIDPVDYRTMKAECEEKINRLEAKLAETTTNTSTPISIDKLIYKAVSTLSHLDSIYTEAAVTKKREIIGSIYPEKLCFDGLQYRTTRINEAVQLIYDTTNELGAIKNRKSSDFSHLSGRVERTGIEPVIPP